MRALTEAATEREIAELVTSLTSRSELAADLRDAFRWEDEDHRRKDWMHKRPQTRQQF